MLSIAGIKMYLDPVNEKLQVPEFLFSIIMNKVTKENLVYVIYHDPYVTSAAAKSIHKQFIATFGKIKITPTTEFDKIGYTFNVPYDDFVTVYNKKYSNYLVSKYQIPLTQGGIDVVQDPNDLNMMRASVDIPKTNGDAGGNFE